MSTSPEPPAVPASTSPSATPAPHASTTATTTTPPPPVSSPPHINITTATPPVPPSSSSAAPAPDDATTIAHLALTNSELQKRRLDAEKDRELFRDMYGKASAYASEVSKENSVLEERAARAEKQVRDGLALVRGTYEAQLLALQAEVKRLKGLNALLVEKDLRSNGDDVRRRAAQCEGLQVENQRLRADLAELRRDYRRMERVLEQLGERELKELSEEEEDIKHTLETTPDVPVILEPIDTPEIVVGKVEIVEAR